MGSGTATDATRPRRGWADGALLPCLVLAGCLALTWAAVRRERAKTQAQVQTYFQLRAQEAVARIQERLKTYEQVLRDTRGFLENRPAGRRDFHAYLSSMDVQTHFPGILGVGYTVLVPLNRRAAHEAAIRAEGFPDYAITPLGDRDPLSAIIYLEPASGRNLRAFGYDMYSEPVRRAAMDMARDLGDPVMSGRVHLVQEDGQDVQAGFLMFLPVRNPDGSLQAWVYAPFRMRDLLTGILGGPWPELDLEVYDGDQVRPASLMFDSHVGPERRTWNRIVLPLEAAHHRWTIQCVALPALQARLGPGRAGTVAVAGLAVSLLLALLTGSLVASRNRAFAQAELRERLNRDLERKVQESVAELRRKDQVLVAQSRHAAMGEMIGAIAHQWRQPLSSLGMLLANLRDEIRTGTLDPADMEEAFTRGFLLIDRMSATINDFRNFFRPDREPVAFSAMDQVRRAVDLVGATLRAAGIDLQFETPRDFRLQGYPNEYCQVLLNLLGNAQEAVWMARTGGGTVRIGLAAEDGCGVLTVTDDGVGIPDAVLERMFEPYFSTREGGTGIGLYMSKQIIETHMGGRISARNLAVGAELRVAVPLAKEQP